MTVLKRRRLGLALALLLANLALGVAANTASAGTFQLTCSFCPNGDGALYGCCHNIQCNDPKYTCCNDDSNCPNPI